MVVLCFFSLSLFPFFFSFDFFFYFRFLFVLCVVSFAGLSGYGLSLRCLPLSILIPSPFSLVSNSVLIYVLLNLLLLFLLLSPFRSPVQLFSFLLPFSFCFLSCFSSSTSFYLFLFHLFPPEHFPALPPSLLQSS